MVRSATSEEYGSRSRWVLIPAAPARALWVRFSSTLFRRSDTAPRSAWVNVWAPISFPLASSARTSSGYLAAWAPTTKKVAGMPWRRRTSRIAGVHLGSGPSSNVRATVLSGSGADRTVGPDRSRTGPEAARLAAGPGGGTVDAPPTSWRANPSKRRAMARAVTMAASAIQRGRGSR